MDNMGPKEEFFFGDISDIDLTDCENIEGSEVLINPPKKARTRAQAVKKAVQTITPEQTVLNAASTASTDPEKIYTVRQTAEYLQCRTETILRKIYSGEIIAFKLGNEWRIKKYQIDNYLNNNISKTSTADS